ncbi:MAG: hypothetical protein H6922_05715 [Pseudomonadaceae bacterium]|nr:hypothetical protein [Pseudomonadaceae bacterium]
MSARPVPRNIDQPNRVPEYVITWVVSYYGTLFLTGEVVLAFFFSFLAVYLMYRFTLDKPEGIMMRILYRYVQIGKLRPTPRLVKRFELG